MDLSKYGIPGGLSHKEYNSQTQPYQIFNFFNGITNNKINTNNLLNLQFGGGESGHLKNNYNNECNSVYLIFNHPAFEVDEDTIIKQLKENPETDGIHKIKDLHSLFAEMKAMNEDEDYGQEEISEENVQDDDEDDDEEEDDEDDDEDEEDDEDDDEDEEEDDEDDDEDDEDGQDDDEDDQDDQDDDEEERDSQDNESTASLGAILDMLNTHYSSAKSNSK